MFSCYYINNFLLKNIDEFCVCSDVENIYLSIFKDEKKILKTTNLIINTNFEDIGKNLFTNKIYSLLDWRFYLSDEIKVYTNVYVDNWFDNNEDSIDLKFTNIPKNIREIYLDVINKFEINEIIINNVSNFLNKIKNKFLGVHIRTWTTNLIGDKYPYLEKRQIYYNNNVNKFIKAINDSKYEYVVICSDNYNEINANITPFISKKIFFYEKNDNLNNLQNIMCELLILSKSNYLIGSLNSTFTELAWWYSQCLIDVKII